MNITESERKILNLLWDNGSLSTMQITKCLDEETGWSKQAVISFLKRMEAKELVTYVEKGRSKYYIPLVEKEKMAKEERTSFLEKFYQGKLGLMVSAMAEEEALTNQDIADLRALLDSLQQQS